jgi:hypothetical protein
MLNNLKPKVRKRLSYKNLTKKLPKNNYLKQSFKWLFSQKIYKGQNLSNIYYGVR